jgi:hypothetical protein
MPRRKKLLEPDKSKIVETVALTKPTIHDRTALLEEQERLLQEQLLLQIKLKELSKQLVISEEELILKYVDALLEFVPNHTEDCVGTEGKGKFIDIAEGLEVGCNRCILLNVKKSGKWDKDKYILQVRIKNKREVVKENPPMVNPVRLGIPEHLKDRFKKREEFVTTDGKIHMEDDL